jgi:hypothetical protein
VRSAAGTGMCRASRATPVIIERCSASLVPSARSWEHEWQHLTGWKRWLVVTGAVHASFTDVAILAGQIDLDTGADLPATRSMEITRAYTRAFFDWRPARQATTVAGRTIDTLPEVTFCAVETHTCA